MHQITSDGAQESLVELTPYLESGAIDAEDIDLAKGTLDRGDGTTAAYAIPADTLTGAERIWQRSAGQPALHPDV